MTAFLVRSREHVCVEVLWFVWCYINVLLVKNPGNSKSVFTFLLTLLPMRFSPCFFCLVPQMNLRTLQRWLMLKNCNFLPVTCTRAFSWTKNTATWCLSSSILVFFLGPQSRWSIIYNYNHETNDSFYSFRKPFFRNTGVKLSTVRGISMDQMEAKQTKISAIMELRFHCLGT